MASQNQTLHFVLLPHLAHGHLIPMVDMAKLLATRGLSVTIITTPSNAARFERSINRSTDSGLQIQLLKVPFPSIEVGLPEVCESMDMLPSRSLYKNLLMGISKLQEPVEKFLLELKPRLSCIISDKNLAWTQISALRFGVPRLVFDGTSCFSLLCTHNIIASKVYENMSESEPFVVPGLPDRIELTKLQLPNAVNISPSEIKDLSAEIKAAEFAANGVVINSFQELESQYVEEFRKVRGDNVWCIGPLSLCNKNSIEKAERCDQGSINAEQCLKWLDFWPQSSVIYACLGSQSRLTLPQLIELGLGLEASNRPFIWVIREGKNKSQEFEKWIENFEESIKERGLLIKGWAPQVVILSHKAIGGFLTHCGWNSVLEGICEGVPMLTWPLFAEQFYNERFVVNVLKIGVSLGAKFSVKWGEEEKFGVPMKREMVGRGIEELMGFAEEREERRERAREIGAKAKRAIEECGSSYDNLTLLIRSVVERLEKRNQF